MYNKNLENIKIIREKEREEDRTIVKLNITKTDNNEVKKEKKRNIMNIIKLYITITKNDDNNISFNSYLEKNIIKLKRKYPNINSSELAKICSNEYKNELNKKYPNKNNIVIISCDEYIEEKLNNIGNLFD